MNTTWRYALAVVGTSLCAITMAGCGGPRQAPQPAATPPAATAAQTPKATTLPATALVKLDDMKPGIIKPANASPADLPAQAVEDVAEAEQRIGKGDFPGAITLLERAAGFASDNPRIRRDLGLAYANLPDRGKATDNLRRAVAAAPDDLEVQVLLGRLSAAQNQSEQAIVYLRTALKCTKAGPSEPAAAEALVVLGQLLQQENYYTAALECYSRLEEWIDKAGSVYAARPMLRDVVVRPERLQTQRGALLMLLQRPSEAKTLLEQAYHRDRSDALTGRLLLQAMIGLKQYPAAEKMLVEMAAEPAQAAVVQAVAEELCQAANDKAMPQRIWQACRKNKSVDGALAVMLARTAQRMGAADQAEAIIKSVLAAMPGNVPAGRFMAESCARNGQHEQALRTLASLLTADAAAAQAVREGVYQVALAKLPPDYEKKFADIAGADSSPSRYALHYVAGELAIQRGKNLLAAQEFQLATEAKKDFYPAYESLMDVYLLQRQYDQAERLGARVDKALEGSAFSLYLSGKLKAVRGDFKGAIVVLEQARTRDRAHVPTALLLSEAYEQTNQPEQASQALLSVLSQDVDNPLVYRRLFQHYMNRHMPEQARAVVSRFLERQGDSLTARLMATQLELAAGQRARGLAMLEQLRKDAPGSPDVSVLAIATELSGDGKTPPGKDTLERSARQLMDVVSQDPRNLTARSLLVEVLKRLEGLSAKDQQKETIAIWARVYEQSNRHPDIGKSYVGALTRAERYAEAAGVLKQMLAEGPGDVTNQVLYVSVLEKLQQYGDALKTLDALLASNDTAERMKLTLRQEKLRIHGLAKQYDEAVAFARQWINDGAPEEVYVARRLIMGVLADGKQFDKLQPLLDDWIAACTGAQAAPYRALKLRSYGKAGKVDEARKYAEDWIKENPKDLVPREMLIVALGEADRHDEALKVLEGWLKAEPIAASGPATEPAQRVSFPGSDKEMPLAQWCRQGIVQTLMAQRNYEQALQRLEEFLKIDGSDAELLSLKGSCLNELGRVKDGTAVLEKAMEANPDDANLGNNLGYTYADQGINLDKAERLIRQALAARPGSSAVMDSLGWVFYKQGRFTDAARTFEQLLDKGEETDAVLYDHAGDVYYRVGGADKVAKAIELWTKALEVAKKEKHPGGDTQRVLTATQGKIDSAKAGAAKGLAPLGEGVKDPAAK